jgi:acyl-CoA thioester hydrolase
MSRRFHYFCAGPKLALPVSGTEFYRLERVVGEQDIDLLGHASNIAFVRWIQDAALAHSAAVGFDFDAYRRIGAIFVIVRHEVDYLRPALRGDLVEARTWISSVMAAKCHRATDLLRKSDGRLLAKALTTWGFIELATRRPRRIDKELLVAFAPFIGERENREG